MSIDDSIRQQLIILARKPKAQVVSFTLSSPTDWRPESVRRPDGEFNTHFNSSSAWEFIATQLESGCEVEIVNLQKPPGKKAYVMTLDLGNSERELYVKVQLGSGKIIGRSFHYSEHPKKRGINSGHE
ncbi:MAG: hypothetical protein F4X56_00185 [Gammaproteobacteria bacterium]|nr:hypothetical protein [Gammaproteobacteria bacterium]MYC24316.1 hypothetical protein [Gammaproteobacteria bacterium]